MEFKQSLITHLRKLSSDSQADKGKTQEFLIYTSQFKILELYRTWMLIMLENNSISLICKEKSIPEMKKVITNFKNEFQISDQEIQTIIGDSMKAMIFIVEHGLEVKMYLEKISKVIGTMITKLLQFRKSIAFEPFWTDLYASIRSIDDMQYTKGCLTLIGSLGPIMERLCSPQDSSFVEFFERCLGNNAYVKLAVEALSSVLTHCKIPFLISLRKLAFLVLKGTVELFESGQLSDFTSCVKRILTISETEPRFFYLEIPNLILFCESMRDKFKSQLQNQIKVMFVEISAEVLTHLYDEKKLFNGNLFIFSIY